CSACIIRPSQISTFFPYTTLFRSRIQRNFEPMKRQVEVWKGTRVWDESAKLVIYRAFVRGELDVPKHLARRVHGPLFQSTGRGIRPTDDMESLQRVHKCVQGT